MKLLKLLFVLFPIIFLSCDVNELEEDDCRSCWGMGWKQCSLCHGTGYCTHCEWGWIDCTWCSNGYRWNNGEYVACTYCSDSSYKGKRICPFCGGHYINKCSACHGVKKTCNDCNGTGKIQ